jgi:pyruvate kinase
MLEAGMTIARLNFSHGTANEHRRRADEVRRLAHELDSRVEVMQDLQGPKIRTVETPPTRLRRGEVVTLAPDRRPDTLQLSEPWVLDLVAPGQLVYLDDGLIELEAVEREDGTVRCRVVIGGMLAGNKGVMFPGLPLRMSALVERDLEDLEVGREIGVEWVALSFVQHSADLERLRELVAAGTRTIAKIETDSAVREIEPIAAAADAVMIARGDLGVAIPRARLPIVQKDIVHLCRRLGKRSIVATEMLLSMVRNPHPTRAEVSDVATAVFDGCNDVMLSEETAIGAYPAEAVAEMHTIVETAEASGYYTWS